MRLFALFLIRLYQRWISPHKGFCCAYRVYSGRRSCSALGYRAIRQTGVRRGLVLLHQRMALCGEAHRRMHPPLHGLALSQRGVCDVSCDLPGDCSCGDSAAGAGSRLCDVLDCASGCADCGSCDLSSRKKRTVGPNVHIPTRRRRSPPPGPGWR